MCRGGVGEAWGRHEGGVREVSGRCRGDVEEVCRVGSRRSGWDACVGRAWQLVLVSHRSLRFIIRIPW